MNYSKIKNDWEKRGFSWGIWQAPLGQIWLDYIHAPDELVMLLEGEIELSFCGNFPPQIGEEVWIPARERHTVINIGNTTNNWYYGYKQEFK